MENASEKKLKWLHKSHEMNQSEHLEVVESELLLEDDKVWNSSYNIKDEIAGEVVD